MNTKRRSLVLVSESAHHPFRMSLPPHVLRADGHRVTPPRARFGIDLGNWRGFLAAYCATFAAVLLYIS